MSERVSARDVSTSVSGGKSRLPELNKAGDDVADGCGIRLHGGMNE